MATILKCKMCGGDISVSSDMSVGTCDYCGSTMTLPRIDTDKMARLFNRAVQYRINCEFDKAYDTYNAIVAEDEQESEAYWGLILSEYGVEYVEDGSGHGRIPTCHRTRMQSILDNTNYKLAIKYASSEQKMIYRDEAENLDRLQRQIISISSSIEPYDVFICYKETDDETGERTKDSLIAEGIFNELEKQNVRTFYSRISLEEHLGENYEPYIYAALQSSRIMLVVSTNSNYVESIWVKNEWGRFLNSMDQDDDKILIPVFQDSGPYIFPNALSKYQVQDMGKVGAINDLVRGIKKILGGTRTEKRDATIASLVEYNQKQKAQLEKIKGRTKKAVISAFVVIAIVTIGIIIGKIPDIVKAWYSHEIAKKSITVENGIPNSDEYLKLTVVLNQKNFDEYFELVPVGTLDDIASINSSSTLYTLKSKLYDEGWRYGDCTNCRLQVEGYYRISKKAFQHTYTRLEPITVISASESDYVPNLVLGRRSGEETTVTFYSQKVVEQSDLTYFAGYLKSYSLKLKDGEKIENSFKNNELLYYAECYELYPF